MGQRGGNHKRGTKREVQPPPHPPPPPPPPPPNLNWSLRIRMTNFKDKCYIPVQFILLIFDGLLGRNKHHRMLFLLVHS